MHIQINTHVNTYTKSANIGKYIYIHKMLTRNTNMHRYIYTQIPLHKKYIYKHTYTNLYTQIHI